MPFQKKRVKVSNENEEMETPVSQPKKVVRKKVVKQLEATQDNNDTVSKDEQDINISENYDNDMNDEKVNKPVDDIHISKLSCLTFEELLEFAEGYGIKKDTSNNIRRQELMQAIVRAQHAMEGKIIAEGTLETLQDGFGFLRS